MTVRTFMELLGFLAIGAAFVAMIAIAWALLQLQCVAFGACGF